MSDEKKKKIEIKPHHDPFTWLAGEKESKLTAKQQAAFVAGAVNMLRHIVQEASEGTEEQKQLLIPWMVVTMSEEFMNKAMLLKLKSELEEMFNKKKRGGDDDSEPITTF